MSELLKRKIEIARETLGVPKKFRVSFSIPTTGVIYTDQITVNAINRQLAIKKAIDLVYSGGVDAEMVEPIVDDHDYSYADEHEWDATVHDEKGNEVKEEPKRKKRKKKKS